MRLHFRNRGYGKRTRLNHRFQLRQLPKRAHRLDALVGLRVRNSELLHAVSIEPVVAEFGVRLPPIDLGQAFEDLDADAAFGGDEFLHAREEEFVIHAKGHITAFFAR